jgi:hypothetical protein
MTTKQYVVETYNDKTKFLWFWSIFNKKEMHKHIPPMFWWIRLGGSKQDDVQFGLRKTFKL